MVRAKQDWLPLSGGTMTGDLGIGLNKLKTTNHNLYEYDANTLDFLRGTGPYKSDVLARYFKVQEGFDFSLTNTGVIRTNALIGAYVSLQSYDTEFRGTAKLVGGKLELALAKLTGTLDCNNQVLKDPKNTTGALTGTPKVVEIDIGGVPYYFEVLPTKG